MAQEDFFRAFGRSSIDGHNLIHDSEQGIERRLNGVTPVDCDVAMQNFLEHLGIRHESLPITDDFFQRSLRVNLVRMGRSDEIHRNVRIHQNHGWESALYPLSI